MTFTQFSHQLFAIDENRGKEWRTMRMVHSCVSEFTVATSSGKPFGPSTHAIRISCTRRFGHTVDWLLNYHARPRKNDSGHNGLKLLN